MLRHWATNNEVQGPTTNNQWSIGDDSLKSQKHYGGMTQQTTSIRMTVLGSQRYDTLVSNIDQPSWERNQQARTSKPLSHS